MLITLNNLQIKFLTHIFNFFRIKPPAMKKIVLLCFLSICLKSYAQCYSSISAKGFHNLTLHSDDTLWVWGQNNYHQLGNNSIINQSDPVQIASGSNWLFYDEITISVHLQPN